MHEIRKAKPRNTSTNITFTTRPLFLQKSDTCREKYTLYFRNFLLTRHTHKEQTLGKLLVIFACDKSFQTQVLALATTL